MQRQSLLIDAPKKYESYEELKADFAKFTDSSHKTRLLPEIRKPWFTSFQSHLDNATYVTLSMYEDKRITTKPLPARSRDVKFAVQEKEGKERDTKESIYKLIPKKETAGGKVAKKDSVLSWRHIAKKLGCPTGHIPNGDKLCQIVNSFSDPEDPDKKQVYKATNTKAASKEEYISTIVTAIDSKSPPIVSYDFVPQEKTEIGERKGERETTNIIVGYIQTTGEAPQTFFAIAGDEGYFIASAEQLYNSTNQLEAGRTYSKEKSDFDLDNEGRRNITPEIRESSAKLKREFKDSDAVKVVNTFINKGDEPVCEWFPVPKLEPFFSRGNILLPEKDRRKVPYDPECWKNNIVVIQPSRP